MRSIAASGIPFTSGWFGLFCAPLNETVGTRRPLTRISVSSGPNAMLGQPGRDRFYGNGGDDIIDARDGVRDFSIQCGRGSAGEGRALTDSFDPPSTACAERVHGEPVPGLNNSG